MTKELIELITYACEHNLWAEEWYIEEGADEDLCRLLKSPEADMLKSLAPPTKDYCEIVKKFETPEECREYEKSVSDAQDITIEYSVKTGAGGMTVRDTNLFGRFLQWDNLLFIDVNRFNFLYLMSIRWVWRGGRNSSISGNFIDFMNRNGGKHWDELLKNPEEENDESSTDT